MSMATIHTGDVHHRPIQREGDDEHCPYVTGTLLGWLALLRIDLRRAGGPWLVPIALLFAVLTVRNTLTPGVAVWPEITEAIGMMAMPLVIVAVAIGALAGGRERRVEVAEQTAGTAMVAWQRYLSVAASVFLWALAMYALVAVALILYGAMFATWGGPEWGVITVPVPILALGASFGVLVGRVVKDRVAPVMAIALFVLLFAMPFVPNAATRPLNVFGLSGWFRPVVEDVPERPFSVMAQLAWGIGLSGTVMGISILWERRAVLSAVLPGMAIVAAVVGALSITGSGYREGTFVSGGARAVMTSPSGSACDDSGAVVVCVHPAYERMLPDFADDVNTYLAPMAGLDGVVDEVYLSSGNGMSAGWDGEGGRAFTSVDLSYERDLDAVLARDLWPMSFQVSPKNATGEADIAQYVVMTARAQEIGVDEWPEWFYRVPQEADDPALHAAIERFADLSAEDQRAWLEANWDDLSHGRLTLEDLP